MKNNGENMNMTEKKIAQYFGREFCYLTGSGTSAIYILLKCFNKEKAKVLFPSITCMAPVNAALYAKVEPLFCDVSLNDYTMDTKSLKKILDENEIDIIVPTHIYGNSCDMDSINEIIKNKNIFLLEDAAQSVGGLYNGKKLGSFGDASVVSFGHTKILECGGGGAVLTDNKELYLKVCELGKNLFDKPSNLEDLFNEYRHRYYNIINLIKKDIYNWELMLELQKKSENVFIFKSERSIEGKIFEGIDKIYDIKNERELRKSLYDKYLEKTLIKLPTIRFGSVSWRYSFIYTGNRDEFVTKVREKNIDISTWYPSLYKMYSKQNKELFPNSNYIEEHIINLWTTHLYSEEKIMSDIGAINSIMKS